MNVKFDKDLTKWWDSYFNEKNGYKPKYKLIEGRNFTNETLHYMTKPYIARNIMDAIEAYTQGQKILMIEICAGIGGNTLEFLSRKNVGMMIAFERNPERAVMLQRNILAYDLGDKVMVQNAEISGNEDMFKDYKDVVFYMDPPWLPEDLTEAGSEYHSSYITKGMKVGDLTLEQWLSNLRNSAYIVSFRLPPNYQLDEVPGWTYEIISLGKSPVDKIKQKDGKLYICINNKYIDGAPEDKFGGLVEGRSMFLRKVQPPPTEFANKYARFQRICNSKPYTEAIKDDSCKIFVKYGFVDPEPLYKENKVTPVEEVKETTKSIEEKVAEIDNVLTKNTANLANQVVTGLVLPRISNEAKRNTGSPEWVAELQEYVKAVLKAFVPNEDMCNQMVDGRNMATWIKCFTHSSVQDDESKNYESLETLGDAFLKFGFILFLYKKLGNSISAHYITTINSVYMSENWQQHPSKKTFGFRDWVWTNDNVTNKTDEDLLEAFIGAIHETGNNVKAGLGAYLCSKFIDFFCSKIVFYSNLDEYENKLTFVRQLIEEAYGGQNYIEFKCSGAPPNAECKCFVIDEILQKLRNDGFNVKNPIGVGKAQKQKDAEKIAADNAVNYLNSLGINRKWMEAKKKQRTILFEDISKIEPELVLSIKEKLRKAKIPLDKVDLAEIHSGKNYRYNLVMINDDGIKIVLASGEIDSNKLQAKIKAVKKYLS